MKKNLDMLHGNVLGNLLRFTLPLVLTGWLQILFSSADSPLLSSCSSSAFLAVWPPV